MVVRDNRELIRRNVVTPPDNEVAEVASGNVSLRSEMLVNECDLLAIRDAKTPVHALGRFEIAGA